MRYRGWMWTEAVELIERAERLHRQFFQRAVSAAGPGWQPPIDLFEDGDGNVTLLVALPGVPPEELEFELKGHVLRVAGNRPWPCNVGAAAIRRLEIPHGRFERVVELPHELFAVAQHELRDGCLTLRLRRR